MSFGAKPLKSLVLIGMMGAGKTSISQILAGRLGLTAADSDADVVRAAGQSIAEIFANAGEPAFREMEYVAIEHLLSGKPMIIATGGGAFVQRRTHDLIQQMGTSIWLKAKPETIMQRLAGDTTRPLLQGEDADAKLKALLAERTPIYSRAHMAFETDGKTPDDIAREIYTYLLQHEALS